MKIPRDIVIVKSNGENELFDVNKLEASLIQAGVKQEHANRIIEHVILNIRPEMKTSEIYSYAHSLLGASRKDCAAKYSLRRAVSELGPTGFPFELFIAELFKTQGYETLTDIIVNGKCVEHEMDIIAFNKDKLIMSEAKFHNELGIKSDLKVVLYIKARFDDLSASTFDFGRLGRKLDEGWIVTNTKFTSTAIKYGVCQNIKLVGWNYPLKGNLHNMIEDAKLHPITTLNTLNKMEKNSLINSGVVLCRELEKHQGLMKKMGMKQNKIKLILDEVEAICNI